MRRLLALTAALTLALTASAGAQTVKPRIVGGTTVAAGDYAWQVALIAPGFGQYCGGTLVDAQHVLSADHCAPRVGEQVRVNSVQRGSGGELIDIQSVRRHPLAEGGLNPPRYDVTMIKLAAPVAAPHPIAVATTAESSLWAPPANLTITGWGDLADRAGTGSESMQEAIVPATSDATCAATYGTNFKAADMFCAGVANSTDTCQGDSGGPIVSPVVASPSKSTPADWRLVGVTSWGAACASAPGVYARIGAADIRDWISLTPPVAATPTLTGTAEAGSTMTCDRGAWTGGTAYVTYRFYRQPPGGSPTLITARGAPTYTVAAGDAGQDLSCVVVGDNAVATAASGASAARTVAGQYAAPTPAPAPQPVAPIVPVVPAPEVPAPAPDPSPLALTTEPVAVAPPVAFAPDLTTTRRCTRARRCTFTVRPTADVARVRAAVTTTTRRWCQRDGRRRLCARTTSRTLRVRRTVAGRFTTSTARLSTGRHTLVLVAIDRDGAPAEAPYRFPFRI